MNKIKEWNSVTFQDQPASKCWAQDQKSGGKFPTPHSYTPQLYCLRLWGKGPLCFLGFGLVVKTVLWQMSIISHPNTRALHLKIPDKNFPINSSLGIPTRPPMHKWPENHSLGMSPSASSCQSEKSDIWPQTIIVSLLTRLGSGCLYSLKKKKKKN